MVAILSQSRVGVTALLVGSQNRPWIASVELMSGEGDCKEESNSLEAVESAPRNEWSMTVRAASTDPLFDELWSWSSL